jgi:hypothetical protein
VFFLGGLFDKKLLLKFLIKAGSLVLSSDISGVGSLALTPPKFSAKPQANHCVQGGHVSGEQGTFCIG